MTLQKLTPRDITFLQDESTLFSIDYRAISESMEYDIPAMWRYENLLPWILSSQKVVVNEGARGILYKDENDHVVIPTDDDPKISVYKRMEQEWSSESIKKLWVGIPHPDADSFARKNKMELSYSHERFLKLNNKISQKKILGDMTPMWSVVSSGQELNEWLEEGGDGYIKREYGSGGFTVFTKDQVKSDENFKTLFSSSEDSWYVEEVAKGGSWSIQCVRERNSSIVFGISEQLVEDGRYYAGSEIKNIDTLSEKMTQQLDEVLSRVDSFLGGYEGFFGIDFIWDSQEKKLSALELNVRMTAATIPTLMYNAYGWESATYKEDFPGDQVTGDMTIITKDAGGGSVDVLYQS